MHGEDGDSATRLWHRGAPIGTVWDTSDVALKRLKELQDELEVTYRTLNRVISERGIERLKRAGMRDTWVDEDAVRAAFAEPQRRPPRAPRASLPATGDDAAPR